MTSSVTYKFLFLFLVITTALRAQNENIFINEFMLSNDGTLSDAEGDYEDWIEIYNGNTSSVNLGGYGLSDEEGDAFKWIFPAVTVPPQGYLVVFASGKNAIFGNEIHTNFKLKAEGEPIILTAPDGALIDRMNPVSVATDIAYGRVQNGAAHAEALSASSPGASNTSVNGLVFSHQSGFYTETVPLSITSNNGDPIYYTTDGSDPSPAAQLFTGTVELAALIDHPDVISQISTSPDWEAPSGDQFNAHVIKAASFSGGQRSSKIYHKTIFVDENMDTRFADFHLVSVITEQEGLFSQETGIFVQGVHFDPGNPVWTGNYFQRGTDWERSAHLEYFSPTGEVLLSHGVGVRTHGGKGRNAPQKSMRIYARSQYGSPKINYPFFENPENRVFDKFVIKNVSGCWNNTIIKDECTAKVCEDLNFESLDAKPVIVFINGEYWGMQSIREYFDEKYLVQKYDYEEDSVNIVLHLSGGHPVFPSDWGILEGTNTGHIALYDFLDANDLSVPENYEQATEMLDISSIIDYYCAGIYFNNKDWPKYNNKLWNYGTYGPWKQIMYDVDAGWGYFGSQYNLLGCVVNTPGCYTQTDQYGTYLIRKLLASDTFKTEFIERMACLMENEFAADRVNEIVEDFRSQYAQGIDAHIGRWNYPSSVGSWQSSVNSKLIGFANSRKAHVISHLEEEFGIVYDFENYDCEEEIIIISDTEEAAESAEEEFITVIPNPSYNKQVSLDYNISDGRVAYEVLDLNGRLLQRGTTGKRERIEMNFAQGVYFIRVSHEDRVITKKIILL